VGEPRHGRCIEAALEMTRVRGPARTARAAAVAVIALVAGGAGAGCETTPCQPACDEAFEECLERIPPGAPIADCHAGYLYCSQECRNRPN
jgi:hypothetical protein